MSALQARAVGANNEETPVKQASKGAGVAGPATLRNRRRPGLYKPADLRFPLFHAWRP